MKKISMLCVVLIVGFAWVCVAEDLGEIAKKEKARREAIAKSGKKSKTLTNADIPNIKSELAIQQTSPPEGEAETSEAAVGTEAAEGSEAPATAETESAEEASTAASEELERLKQEKQELEQQIQETRESVGQGGVLQSANVGSQFRAAREAEQKVKELDEKIKELEKKKTEEEQQ